MAGEDNDRHRVPAVVHFSTGAVVVLFVALLSWSLHNGPILRDLQTTSLDMLFLSHKKIQGYNDIAVVSITDQDYADLFHRQSPLNVPILSDLIVACARSGARVIGVDMITSDWTAEQRQSARDRSIAAAPKVRIVWADDGWPDDQGKLHINQLSGLDEQGHVDCQAVPAAIPDDHGIVRGYLPGVQVADGNTPQVLPAMATILYDIYQNGLPGCAPEGVLPAANTSDEQIVNYSGGGAAFPYLSAATVLQASNGEAWINANPLRGHIALIGGSFREGRDRYVTPAGYMDGVDILAQTVLSNSRPVKATSRLWFTLSDLFVGMLLLTSTWFLHRAWVLILSFLLIPIIAMAASYVVFTGFGYFASFVPVIAGVFLHHLVEHAIEHWRLTKEVQELRRIAGRPFQPTT